MSSSSVSLLVASSKDTVPKTLNETLARVCVAALEARGVFTIALSGGSLPSFLKSVKESFISLGKDPMFDKWHVILADERCVPSTDGDSNLGSLQKNFLSSVPIPESQIYGIDETKLSESTEAVATDYEAKVRQVLSKSGNQLDLAVLGFGPDGHTCSLFPNHALLNERTKWVAWIEDSPKPPPKRITLTFPVLNENTRHVIFCGAGSSKSPIIQKVMTNVTKVADSNDNDGYSTYQAALADPPPFPCAMVRPLDSLTWVVDADAMAGVAKI